ncbi:haloacid dehalogenase-like hydrolase domain-containing protein 2 [Rhipicephalus microplus]|uniref:haloacid dehalogenase-like hydrolase domain-containing protein 2 n=1 Tax=Rhipicephalus microplus TaxID=6941 RepID=UPI003F6A95F6
MVHFYRKVRPCFSLAYRLYSVMTSARHVKAALIDLSGTLHVDDKIIPGAVKALERLRAAGIQIKFVTNTTKESRRRLHERLVSLGFKISADEIFSSLTAARTFIEVRNLRPHLMVSEAAMEEFEGMNTNDPNAVLIGLAPEKFNYTPMNEAFRLVLDGAVLVAIHKARYYRTNDSLALGPGPFVRALEFATNKTAEIVGKPDKTFFLTALRQLHALPEDTVMIGDDVRDDIDGAQQVGIRGILVKTGKYMVGDEIKIENRPWALVPSFVDAVNMILKPKV